MESAFFGMMIITLVIAFVVLVIWVEWIIGRAIGKRLSQTVGLVIGIILMICGFGLSIGISMIVYSSRNKDPNFEQIPNSTTDKIPVEKTILLLFNKTPTLTLKKIIEDTNLGIDEIENTLKKLISKGVIKKETDSSGKNTYTTIE